jgi:hypothetical protein
MRSRFFWVLAVVSCLTGLAWGGNEGLQRRQQVNNGKLNSAQRAKIERNRAAKEARRRALASPNFNVGTCPSSFTNLIITPHLSGDGVSTPNGPYIETSFRLHCGSLGTEPCSGYVTQLANAALTCHNTSTGCNTVAPISFILAVPTAVSGSKVTLTTKFYVGGNCEFLNGTEFVSNTQTVTFSN